MIPTTHHTTDATLGHDGDECDTDSARNDDFGWTFVEIAFIVVIVLALAGVAVWAVITLRDGSAVADSIDRLGEMPVGGGTTSW